MLAIDELSREIGQPIPVMISVTIEPMGTMLAGQNIEALWASLDHVDVLSLGLNCATGPDFMTDHIRTLQSLTPRLVSCHPNAGLPNEEGRYLETPTSLTAQLERFVDRGWVNIVGGCCGTTPAHIAALAQMAEGKAPRRPPAPSHRAIYSGIEAIEAEESTRPLIVGERTNVIGSRLFKNLVAAEQWEEATEIARRQVKSGAHIVDVCLQSTDRDEIKDIPPFYDHLIRKIKVPLMIDTTDARADRAGAHLLPGQEHHQFDQPGGRRGKTRARLPAGALLRRGPGRRLHRRRSACRPRPSRASANSKSPSALTPCSPENSPSTRKISFSIRSFSPARRATKTTLAARSKRSKAFAPIKEHIPYVRTVLGISNVSFGLPAGAREVVNSVFLYYCTKAGLDLAIVNAERIERFPSIPEHERKLAEDLLFNRPPAEIPDAIRRQSCFATLPKIGARNRASRKRPSINSTSRPSPNISAAPAEHAKRSAASSAARSSGWPTTSSKDRKTASSPISTASSPKASRRSMSSTAR